MRGNISFLIPFWTFELLAGKSNIRAYTFDIHIARHRFTIFYSPRSNVITNFYTSRSNPDGIIVTLACICPGTVTHIEILSFDGHSWEDSYAQSGVACICAGAVTHVEVLHFGFSRLLCRRWFANMVHGLQQAQEKSLICLATWGICTQLIIAVIKLTLFPAGRFYILSITVKWRI